MNSASSPLVRQLETLTYAFRQEKARKHDSSAAAVRREYNRHVDAWIAAICGAPPDLGGLFPIPGGSVADVIPLAPRRAGDAWEPPPSHKRFRGATRFRSWDFSIPTDEWEVAEAQRCVTTQKWHDERARGQRFRFKNLASCGARVRTVQCGVCGDATRKDAVPEGCGVARLCPRCALFTAKKRRARFARARVRCISEAPKHLFRKKREGGRYDERMLTVTLPHFTRDELASYIEVLDKRIEAADDPHPRDLHRRDAAAALLAECKDTVIARVAALWKAWPRFTRSLVRHWKLNRETIDGSARGPVRPKLHRAAEWTLGHDGLGHPHFHVWCFSPWIDVNLLRAWWTDALLDIGVPPPKTRDGLAVLHMKRIYKFDTRMAAELMKGANDRAALELSRVHYIERDAGGVIFKYADGWTIHEVIDVARPEVIASLYEALEGKRLTQASKGFFGEDAPPTCPHCLARGGPNGWAQFRCTFAPNPNHPDAQMTLASVLHERSPP